MVKMHHHFWYAHTVYTLPWFDKPLWIPIWYTHLYNYIYIYVHKYCIYVDISLDKIYIFTAGHKLKHDIYIYIYAYHTSIFLCFHPTKNHETICHSTMYYHGIFQESNLLSVVFHQYLPTRECLGKVYRRGSKPKEPWHGTNGGRFHGWGCVA